MTKQILIPPTRLAVGDSAFSAVILAEEDASCNYRIIATPLDPSRPTQVRVGITDLTDLAPREITNKFVDGEDEAFLSFINPPERFQIEATCLIGTCVVVVESASETGSITAVASGSGFLLDLPPPALANFYLGTNSAGVFGYHLLPGGGATHNHVYDETPAGTINGSNKVFTLVTAPNPANSLALHLNGILMRQGVGDDYLLTGGIISYSTNQVPTVGSTHTATYEIP